MNEYIIKFETNEMEFTTELPFIGNDIFEAINNFNGLQNNPQDGKPWEIIKIEIVKNNE